MHLQGAHPGVCPSGGGRSPAPLSTDLPAAQLTHGFGDGQHVNLSARALLLAGSSSHARAAAPACALLPIPCAVGVANCCRNGGGSDPFARWRTWRRLSEYYLETAAVLKTAKHTSPRTRLFCDAMLTAKRLRFSLHVHAVLHDKFAALI
jgi:hypothetical protein